MQLDGANVVVTGGARGIGAALVRRFHAAGANVVVADVLDASPVAEPLGRAVAVHADVSTEAGNVALIDAAVAAFGPVDLFFANAGLAIGTDLTMPEQEWELAMHVNVDAHRWAAKHLLDGWLARGRATSAPRRRRPDCSPRSARSPYTRHQAGRGRLRRVAVDHLRRPGAPRQLPVPAGGQHRHAQRVARRAAAAVVPAPPARCSSPTRSRAVTLAAIAEERFLVLPHPEVAEYVTRKAERRGVAGSPGCAGCRRGSPPARGRATVDGVSIETPATEIPETPDTESADPGNPAPTPAPSAARPRPPTSRRSRRC